MSQALVSILIPFKNTETFISKCITSIIDQSYTNWEAIFIDDNSEDLSYSIVENFSGKDNRIKLFKNKGSDIIPALQTAYSKSKGTYITRMDSDDIMTSNRLEVMMDSLLKHGKNHLAIGQVKYFRADGVSDGYARYETWINKLTKTGSNYSEIYKECVIPSPCWMLHRNDFEACEGFNPNRYPEDYDLAFRFYKAGYTCIPCDKVLLHWRDYSTRTSRTHEHYAINYFLDIKVHYFLELDHDSNRPLTIWGAGNKGKTVAKLLIEKGIPFHWICDNKKKIGKYIYGKKLFNFNYLAKLNRPQSIVTVANADAQKDIRLYFEQQKMLSMQDYFFFC
ncbi:glycosyltransferase family 2 protein [Winogradskyella luteola]|uniref:Glycosyltransferase family 2 protein n=1 Tax=Winogradskyella luteola TaxID=2828330 RepID=A0A9X1F6D2_9FLAO|nr:glycosyltransferase family 2 protein [Winogradskyella luteola]MBV7268079.1 glycosyltransferase family 2 protein [Winogradskyella luteola]